MKNAWSKLTLADVEAITEYTKLDNLLESKVEIYKVLTGENPIDMNTVEFLRKYAQVTGFMQHEPQKVKVASFTANGEVFKPMLEFKNWSTAQMISLHNVAKSQPNNIALQVAVMCEGKVDAAELERREALIREHAKYDVVYSLALFFWTVYNGFLNNTKDYLTEMKMQNLTTIPSIGDGTYPSTRSQDGRVIYPTLEEC